MIDAPAPTTSNSESMLLFRCAQYLYDIKELLRTHLAKHQSESCPNLYPHINATEEELQNLADAFKTEAGQYFYATPSEELLELYTGHRRAD